MTTQNKSSLGREFVEELIKLFFNPKSYFYHTFEKLLRHKPLPKKTADARAIELMGSLLFLLSRANNANGVLKEVSQLKGFEDVYSSLENELITIRLEQLDKEDTKKFISELAAKTFAQWKRRLSNPSFHNYLRAYIKLKESLFNLLENTNASDTYLDAGDIDNLLLDKNPISLFDNSALAEKREKTHQKENNAFRKFFGEELKSTLEPINTDFQEIRAKDTQAAYLQSVQEIFQKILELANFHDYVNVKQICQETLAFLDRVSQPTHLFSKNDYNLLQAARVQIVNSVAKPNSNGLHEFLDAIRRGKFDPPVEKTPEDKPDAAWKDSQVEYNTMITPQSEPEAEPENTAESNETSQPSLDDEEEIHFALPGEDSEEVINLIKDVSLSVNLPQTREPDKTKHDDSDKTPTPPIDYQSLKGATEREAHQTFAQQAKPMAKIIFDSLKLLKEDYHRHAQRIEDIELASASLKHLARKLNLHKLAFFPELVESICINVSAAELKIPTGFLASIAKGVKHLISYNPDDESHEAILIDILSDLKRYYAHTVKVIEQTQLASS
ncbi:MAG: hypothetical protein GXO74_01945 [Calditrichaeota bacterium]|nr:hypothetical protein [Calditrichota bacterium]